MLKKTITAHHTNAYIHTHLAQISLYITVKSITYERAQLNVKDALADTLSDGIITLHVEMPLENKITASLQVST